MICQLEKAGFNGISQWEISGDFSAVSYAVFAGIKRSSPFNASNLKMHDKPHSPIDQLTDAGVPCLSMQTQDDFDSSIDRLSLLFLVFWYRPSANQLVLQETHVVLLTPSHCCEPLSNSHGDSLSA